MDTDVCVIGLGAMGSAALWQLAERGISAIGIEQFEPGHDRGSSHGESRIFRTAYLEGPGYVPLAQRAVELWKQLDRLTEESHAEAAGHDHSRDTHLITENGALMLGPEGSSVITAVMNSIRTHNLPHEYIGEEDLRRRYPGHHIFPGEVGIREDQGGFVRPEASIRAMVARAESLGARVLRHSKVDRIESLKPADRSLKAQRAPPGRLRSGGVRVSGQDFVCDARHAIVSVGTWLGKLLPDLQLPLRVTRQIPGWYPIERPEWFMPDRFPVFIRDIGDYARPGDVIARDSTFYGFPTLDGQTIKVAIHREGPLTDPDRLDRNVEPEEIRRVQEYIELFLHGVGTKPVQTQVCMYTNTPDHDFLVGAPQGYPKITLLGGFSGHGFKFAPVMGEIAADLATRGETAHPVGFLSPDRFG